MTNMSMKSVCSLSAFALAMIAAAPVHALYKCVDEKGVTHYGDVMPWQCEKKPVVEMSKQVWIDDHFVAERF